jgi:hypothetical protein
VRQILRLRASPLDQLARRKELARLPLKRVPRLHERPFKQRRRLTRRIHLRLVDLEPSVLGTRSIQQEVGFGEGEREGA